MVSTVSPTSAVPNHDLTLTDGSTTVGFVLVTAQGEKNERAIQEYPQVRTALKTTTGEGKYSDYNLPYMSIEQDNWSSGRGNLIFEDDRARFYNSVRAYSEKDGRLLPGGLEAYSTGLRTWQGSTVAQDAGYLAMYGATTYRAVQFTAASSFTISQIQLWIDRIGGAGNGARVAIYSDVAGSPGASLASATYGSNNEPEMPSIVVDISYALVSATTYWIVVNASGTPSATVCPFVYRDSSLTAGTAKKSSDGSTWAAASGEAFAFRLLDNSAAYKPIFFEYKRCLYLVKRFDSGANASLWRNGDRGAADSNSGDKTLLNDATKTWTVNEWAGCIALITSGPGVQEENPFRTITSNTATALTCSPAWNIAHTTATEYIIIGSNKWTSLQSLNGDCTDVAVTGEIVYFALGDNTNTLRYQEYNNSGTWTARSLSDTLKATHLQYIRHPARGGMLFAARISDSAGPGDYHANALQVQDIPDYWTPTDGVANAGMFRLHKLTDNDRNWTGLVAANVTQTLNSDGDEQFVIGAGFTTGTFAIQDIAPMDVSDSNQIAFLIQSSVAASSGQLTLSIDDVITLGHNYATTALWQLASTTYTDLTAARDGDLTTAQSLTLANTSWLMAGCNEQFNTLTVDMATANSNAATLTAQYFNGASWASLTITDNTASGGKTFAQDGTITFTIPYDWFPYSANNQSAYYVRLQPSATTSAMTINEITVKRSNNVTFNLPALTANEWTWIVCAYTPGGSTNPRPTSIQSVGLALTADLGAMTVKLRDAVWAGKNTRYFPINSTGKVTSLAAYSADASGRMNPWIFTDDGVYEMQIDNDFQILPLPIGEITQFSDHRNGRAWCLNDVYIYFNLKNKIERYYNRTLDDIGPDRDIAYTGNVSGIVSYPGHIFASFNGKGDVPSTVMGWKNSGWHSTYEGPSNITTNTSSVSYPQITGMYHQAIPGNNMGRLWIAEERDVLWIPTSPDPENEAGGYAFAPKSILVTSKIYGGITEMIKAFKSLKVISNMPGSGSIANYSVRVEYRTADGNNSWTDLPSVFNTGPSQEINLTATTPPNITGKWIQFRLRLYGAYVPRLDAWVLECYGVVPTKWAYSWTSIIREDYLSINLQEQQELSLGYASRAETAYTQLKTWANNGTPLTLNSRASVYDSKTVILNPPASQPLRIDSLNQHEEIIINLTAFDL